MHAGVRLLAVLMAPLLAGCGGGDKADADRSVVKGKLVDKGNAFSLDPSKVQLPKGATGMPPGVSGSSTLQIVFSTLDGKESYPARVGPEGDRFDVPGNDGKGIKPGKYKVSITARLGMTPDMPDAFKGQFTPEKTQIIREVKAGEEVVIDVSKPQG